MAHCETMRPNVIQRYQNLSVTHFHLSSETKCLRAEFSLKIISLQPIRFSMID